MKEYEKTSSIDYLIEKTLVNLNDIASTKTIFGEPTTMPDGTIIIPVSKVTIGFVVGGGEYSDLSRRRVATHYPMAGGSGGGICLSPIGFVVNTPSEIKFISTLAETGYEKIVQNLSKVTEFLAKKAEKKEKKDESEK